MTSFTERLPVDSIRYIDIEPIACCNLRCSFCQVPGWYRGRETKPMGIGFYKKIIDQLPGLKRIKLQGMGEPFLNRNLIEMIRYATKKGILTKMNTNGTLLKPVLSAEIIKAGLTTITFSFDGALKETYESSRVGADYDKVVSNISYLCRLKKERKSNIEIKIVCLVSNDRVLSELPSLVALGARLGVNKVSVKGYIKKWRKPGDKEDCSFNKEYLSAYSRYEAIMAEAASLASNLGTKFEEMPDEHDPYSLASPCPRPFRQIYVSTEGKVIPCCVVGNPDNWNMGDLTENSVEEVWNNEAYRELRRRIIANDIPDQCKACYSK